MSSSSGRYVVAASSTGDEPLDVVGHLDAREVLGAGTGSRTSTARLSDRPLMYGNGCAGSTASGVSTGNTWRRK